MPKVRRKQYVIAARFQIRYILYILLFLYLGALIAGYTVYYSAWTTLGEKLANVYPRGRLMYIFRQSNITLLVRLLLVSPLFIVIGVILSHRIAGPIYRIGKYIESLMMGDFSRGLTLRKNDEFKVLAVKMTHLCKKLRDDDIARKNRSVELQDFLKENRVSAEVMEKTKAILDEIVQPPSP
ncbi:MAG: methyl-accepting chemotaxis protein [Candidatus Omnitrophota bacterium]